MTSPTTSSAQPSPAQTSPDKICSDTLREKNKKKQQEKKNKHCRPTPWYHTHSFVNTLPALLCHTRKGAKAKSTASNRDREVSALRGARDKGREVQKREVQVGWMVIDNEGENTKQQEGE